MQRRAIHSLLLEFNSVGAVLFCLLINFGFGFFLFDPLCELFCMDIFSATNKNWQWICVERKCESVICSQCVWVQMLSAQQCYITDECAIFQASALLPAFLHSNRECVAGWLTICVYFFLYAFRSIPIGFQIIIIYTFMIFFVHIYVVDMYKKKSYYK